MHASFGVQLLPLNTMLCCLSLLLYSYNVCIKLNVHFNLCVCMCVSISFINPFYECCDEMYLSILQLMDI